jgi:3-phytase
MEQEWSKDKKKMKFSKIPNVNTLNERVKHFKVDLKNKKIDLVKSFGDVEGEGILHKVESIGVDASHGRILIADENKHKLGIKVYSLEGKFLQTFGGNVFTAEPEGFALIHCHNGNGYWIMADQHEKKTIFHIFDRISFQQVASFEGSFTANTDGVCLTQSHFDQFDGGAFYAVHQDGGVSAFSLSLIEKTLKLKYHCIYFMVLANLRLGMKE